MTQLEQNCVTLREENTRLGRNIATLIAELQQQRQTVKKSLDSSNQSSSRDASLVPVQEVAPGSNATRNAAVDEIIEAFVGVNNTGVQTQSSLNVASPLRESNPVRRAPVDVEDHAVQTILSMGFSNLVMQSHRDSPTTLGTVPPQSHEYVSQMMHHAASIADSRPPESDMAASLYETQAAVLGHHSTTPTNNAMWQRPLAHQPMQFCGFLFISVQAHEPSDLQITGLEGQ